MVAELVGFGMPLEIRLRAFMEYLLQSPGNGHGAAVLGWTGCKLRPFCLNALHAGLCHILMTLAFTPETAAGRLPRAPHGSENPNPE